jgi:hypothetical protein
MVAVLSFIRAVQRVFEQTWELTSVTRSTGCCGPSGSPRGVRQFAPDHLLIGLRPGDRAGWQENGLLDQVIERFGLPTTVFQLTD